MSLFSKIKLREILRARPVSNVFGFDRGTPIDRYYIEKFLSANAGLIKGDVLEIAENTYTKKFAGKNAVSHVLHYEQNAAGNNLVGDLCNPATLGENAYDCFICTQTFNFIYHFEDAIRGSYHLLKPGGSLLATTAFMSPISKYDADRWGDYWRFSPQTLRRSFSAVFSESNVQIFPMGNSAAAALFMKGYALEELIGEVELDDNDELYPLIIGIRAVK